VRNRLPAAAALVLAALAASNCGGVTDPSKNTTETFTGTVAPGGRGTIHPVNISNTGEYAVKVTSMTPTFNSVFGTWLGIMQGNDCGLFQQNTFSIVGSQSLSGPIFQKGTYCVFVFDVGTMTTNENYTLTVSHP
jgi:hypothetical protein